MYTDPDGKEIKWAKWSDIKKDADLKSQYNNRGEYRKARRKLKKEYKNVIQNSNSAAIMFKGLDDDDQTHTFIPISGGGGKIDILPNGDTNIKIGVSANSNFLSGITSNSSNIKALIAHEGAHSWRDTQGIQGVEGSIPSLTKATELDIISHNRKFKNNEMSTEHVANIIRGELINSGVKNMDISSIYYGLTLKPTPNKHFKYTLKAANFNLLDGKYTKQGYLNGDYKLPTY